MDPLTGTLLLVAAKAAGTAAGKEAVQFVGPLIGLVSAQQKVLDEIRRDTKALIEAPYLTAKTYLNNAAAAVDPDYQRELLSAAEAKFVDATSQLRDPLTASYAWTASALIKAYLRPAERPIIADHFMNAYRSAVQAGKITADTPPLNPPAWIARPARALSWVIEGLVPFRLQWVRRPQSLRMTAASSLKVPRLGGFRLETYTVTASALEREHRLGEITSYVAALREILLDYGQAPSDVPAYWFGLEAGTRLTSGHWAQTETTYWALIFEPADTVDATNPAERILSEDRKRIKFELLRGS
jgi:hypothetical protein